MSHEMKVGVCELPYVDSANVFEKVADQPWAIFLDSGTPAKKAQPAANAGFDVLAIKPQSTLVFDGEVTHFRHSSLKDKLFGDPISILKSAIPEVDLATGHNVPYMPGALGYFSYDLAREFESIPNLAADHEQLPMMAMGIYYVVLVIDHRQKKSLIIQLGESASTNSIVDEWRDLIDWELEAAKHKKSSRVKAKKTKPYFSAGLLSGMLQENMSRDIYRKRFKSVRRYTIAGDCYQVNLTKQFSAQVTGDAWPYANKALHRTRAL